MTAALEPARPEAAAGRTTFAALAARETLRFARNPVFLAAAGLTAFDTLERAAKARSPRSTAQTRSRRSFSAGSACWPRSG